ncbi:MAG: hypothetical protein WA484_04615 [Solirubrobacteraceae bacterium]
MTEYLSDWNVVLDPEQAEVLSDGSVCREVTLVLVDEPRGSDTRRPVAVTLAPAEARKVASRLLATAMQAEGMVR